MFYYQGNMLDADGPCDVAVTAKIRSTRKNFHKKVACVNWERIFVKRKGITCHHV